MYYKKKSSQITIEQVNLFFLPVACFKAVLASNKALIINHQDQHINEASTALCTV